VGGAPRRKIVNDENKSPPPEFLVSRAQRSTISAFTRVCARYGGALLNRERYKLRV
jgi:hypothetical protein